MHLDPAEAPEHPTDAELLDAGWDPTYSQDDLDAAYSDQYLHELAALCSNEYADLTCLSCLASVILAERQGKREAEGPAEFTKKALEQRDEEYTSLNARDSLLTAADLLRDEIVQYFDPMATARKQGLSVEEFGDLTAAAKKWVESIEASQGLGMQLTDAQARLVNRTREIVTRIRG